MEEYKLFIPVKELFESIGYTIYGEVNDIDVVAKKEEHIIAIELKNTLNLKLVLQAIERQKHIDMVYVAIPKKKFNKEFKNKCNLLKRLSIGLIIVDFKKNIARIEIDPKAFDRGMQLKRNKKKQFKLLKEISQRSINSNIGGVNKKKLMTAYREQALKIVGILRIVESSSAKELNDCGCSEKSLSILTKNFYGWFEKKEKGIYRLSKFGISDTIKYDSIINELIAKHIDVNNNIIYMKKAKVSDLKIINKECNDLYNKEDIKVKDIRVIIINSKMVGYSYINNGVCVEKRMN